MNPLKTPKERRAFFPLEEFPDFKKVAENYLIILEELKENKFWMPWGSDNYDPTGHCQFLKGDWTVCPVYFGNLPPQQLNIPGVEPKELSQLIKSLPTKFPKITKILEKINTVNFAAFSRLHPKSKLAPHKHHNPLSLIFHLGLIIPTNNTCGLSVNKEVHTWKKPGDAIIFDDTLEHSAWNDSDQERIILYIDFLDSGNIKNY